MAYELSVSGITDLSADDMDAVFGGTGSVPTKVDPGTCPSGTRVSSATYDSGGNLTSLTCTPTSTTQQIQEKASLAGTIVDTAKDVVEWVGSFF